MIIAGERSGVGKTTVTLALLACLKQRGLAVQSFKVGPDYIDPMFHRYVTDRPCRNLDPVLTSPAYVQECYNRHTQDVTHALVEGVMGLFDGAVDRPGFASTAHIARLLDLPVLLVLDCSRLSHSIAALVQGYRSFDPQVRLAGVILNRVGSDRHLEILKSALEPLAIPVLGVLRRQEAITIPDRHLGLVPAGELAELQPLIERLAHLGATCFDWQALLPLLQVTTRPLHFAALPEPMTGSPRIAIAQDGAFNFYYADNLELLETLGAELVFWSPLRDPGLPRGTQGLYFGGGFPEVFAAQLEANQSARKAVQTALNSGMPTYAECGGLMYLCDQITNFSGRSFAMAGVLPTTAVMGQRLILGYRQVTTLQDGVVGALGQQFWGHEFHRSCLTRSADIPLYAISNPTAPTDPLTEGWHLPHLHASYIHLHWGSQPHLPRSFLQRCAAYGNRAVIKVD